MKVQLIEGDIARIEADAIVTAINSSGLWFGGIDGVINRVADTYFHRQAADALNQDPDVKVVATVGEYEDNLGDFKHVVFVIDDLHEDLKVVVKRGLDAAAAAGHRKITLPAIRLGVMQSVGGTPKEKVRSMVDAITEHGQSEQSLDQVSLVVYRDMELWRAFNDALKS